MIINSQQKRKDNPAALEKIQIKLVVLEEVLSAAAQGLFTPSAPGVKYGLRVHLPRSAEEVGSTFRPWLIIMDP